MKRKSNITKQQLPKDLFHRESQFDYIRKQAKRNYTTLILSHQNTSIDRVPSSLTKNHWIHAQNVAANFIQNIVNNMDCHIEQIQKRKITTSAISLMRSITHQLELFQDPLKTSNECSPLPQKQPPKNVTDPISGFSKQNFLKKINLRHQFKNDSIISSFKDPSELVNVCLGQQKKLPPLMKQMSEQKLQFFVPLEYQLSRKHSTFDFEEMVRERLLKDIDNRKLKDKIEEISSGIQTNKSDGIKRNSKSLHGQQKLLPKEQVNFDYDGNKISIYSHGKIKSNLKVLKALYKMPRERGDQSQFKLPKKFQQRISYIPRGSKQYLELNSKNISDCGDLNQTAILKEKLEVQLRKTEIRFVEKQYYGKEGKEA